jgi:hypothetical protein
MGGNVLGRKEELVGRTFLFTFQFIWGQLV